MKHYSPLKESELVAILSAGPVDIATRIAPAPNKFHAAICRNAIIRHYDPENQDDPNEVIDIHQPELPFEYTAAPCRIGQWLLRIVDSQGRPLPSGTLRNYGSISMQELLRDYDVPESVFVQGKGIVTEKHSIFHAVLLSREQLVLGSINGDIFVSESGDRLAIQWNPVKNELVPSGALLVGPKTWARDFRVP
jgi:hypothetical protein